MQCFFLPWLELFSETMHSSTSRVESSQDETSPVESSSVRSGGFSLDPAARPWPCWRRSRWTSARLVRWACFSRSSTATTWRPPSRSRRRQSEEGERDTERARERRLERRDEEEKKDEEREEEEEGKDEKDKEEEEEADKKNGKEKETRRKTTDRTLMAAAYICVTSVSRLFLVVTPFSSPCSMGHRVCVLHRKAN